MLTPIYHRIQTHLDRKYRVFDRKKLIPWLSIKSGFAIDDCRGGKISYSGIEFDGSSQDVFWSFMDPCLEDLVEETLSMAGALGREYEPEIIKDGLEETRDLLKSVVTKVYERMVDIDRRLRGKGYPQSVGPHDAHDLIVKMHKQIDARTDALIEQVHIPSRLERFSTRLNQHHALTKLVWSLLLLLAGFFLGQFAR